MNNQGLKVASSSFYRVSLASSESAKEILDLQKLAYQSEARLYKNWNIPPLMQTLEEIEKEFLDHIFYKAVISENIIGSVRAMVQDNTCFIGKLIVHPKLQGKGIGTTLMDTIERDFKDVKRYELFTGTKSLENIHLYKRLGYKPFKEEKINDCLSLLYFEKENKIYGKSSYQTYTSTSFSTR